MSAIGRAARTRRMAPTVLVRGRAERYSPPTEIKGELLA
jgi:hypothetical protein